MVILLTFLLRSADGIVLPEDLAQVKDMATCKTVAALLNKQVEDDPNAFFICREARPAQRS